MIITLTGPSGTGKTEMASALLKLLPHSQILTSVTTRPKRADHIPGEYVYVSPDAFKKLDDEGKFAWKSPLMRGYIYGTSKGLLQTALMNDAQCWIMILVPETVPKLYNIARAAGRQETICSFFIRPPAQQQVLIDRMKKRGDTDTATQESLDRCADWEDQARASGLPYIFIDDPDKDLQEKLDAILAHLGPRVTLHAHKPLS